MPSGYPNDPENAEPRGNKSLYDPEFHPKDVVERMTRGEIDAQVIAAWGITRNTFYRWIRENDELQEAHEKGKALWEKCWFEKGVTFMEGGNREAYKYWAQIMGIKGGDEWKQNKPGQGNTTNINVQQMNQINLENKSELELKEILHTKLEKLNILPSDSLDTEFKVIKDDSEPK